MAKRKMTATQKLRKLVKQQVRRMENRGYRIAPEIKEKVKSGSYQTLKSLQRNKYSKVYEASTSEVEGKIVGGQEKRKYERRESARKSAETRRYWKYVEEHPDRVREEALKEQQWKEERRKQDEQDRLDAELYKEGEITYNEIIDKIDAYPSEGSLLLNEALKFEIEKYGKENVLKAMGQIPQSYIKMAQDIVYYEKGKEAIHSATKTFFELIKNTILDAEELKQLGETMDQMTDMGSL